MKARTLKVELEREIAKNERTLKTLRKKEAASRKKWTAAYKKFRKATTDFAKLKYHDTAKAKGLAAKIIEWDGQIDEKLTKDRDEVRAKIAALQEEQIKKGLDLARLTEQESSEVGAMDEIVTQIFVLNNTVVRAAKDREDCLNRHVFPRLMSPSGKLLTQVPLTSKDGLRRVTAMVNNMTIIRGDLAEQAKHEIQKFFDRHYKAPDMDEKTKILFDLTREILIEKTNFKIGVQLSRFLSLELSERIFPELTEAQRLLRLSISSEKSSSYIRIFERASRTDKWQVVPQS